jgi:hypothetical protein
MSQDTENMEPIGNYMRILSPSTNCSLNGIMSRASVQHQLQKQHRLQQQQQQQIHVEDNILNLPAIPIVTLGGVSVQPAKRSISLVQTVNNNEKASRKHDNKSSSLKSKSEKIHTIRRLMNNKPPKKQNDSNKIKQTHVNIKVASQRSESESNPPAILESLNSRESSATKKRTESAKSSKSLDTEKANVSSICSGILDLSLIREGSLKSRNRPKQLPSVNKALLKSDLVNENDSAAKITAKDVIMATQSAAPIVLDNTILNMKFSSNAAAASVSNTTIAVENDSLSNRSLSNSPSSSSSASNLRSAAVSTTSCTSGNAHNQKNSTIASTGVPLKSLKHPNQSSQEDDAPVTSQNKNDRIKQQSRAIFTLNDTEPESKLLLEAKLKSISSLHLDESIGSTNQKSGLNESGSGKNATTLSNKMNFLNVDSLGNESLLSAPRRRVSENDLKTKEEKEKLFKQLELLHTVGTGTFGRVMLVRNSLNKQYYALKIMSIVEIIRLKQADHVRNEKNVLEIVNSHPFIVRLFWTYHNEQHLYMLFEYIPGGELFSLLRQRTKFEAKAAVFYAAEIVCAFEYLHSLQIVYRDLKPENILLGLFICFVVVVIVSCYVTITLENCLIDLPAVF